MEIKLHLLKNETQADMYENVEYHDFWKGDDREHLDRLEQVLVRQMLKLPARRVVDIGCGFGRLACVYMDHARDVVMVDSSWSQLMQARETTAGKCTYIASNATRLPFRPGSFDRALMIRVFHHIPKEQAENCLAQLERVLCIDGQLLFTYSNKRNLGRIVRWLFGKLPYNPFDLSSAAIWEPFCMNHPRYVYQILSACGFRDFDVRGSGVMDKIVGKLGRFGKQLPLGVSLAPLFGSLALAPWIFVGCQKKSTAAPLAEIPDDYLQCPVCCGNLTNLSLMYSCQVCGRVYPLKDGIIDFRDTP